MRISIRKYRYRGRTQPSPDPNGIVSWGAVDLKLASVKRVGPRVAGGLVEEILQRGHRF